MMVEDDTKLKYLNRLLDEISYTKNYNQMRFDSLKSALTNLKDIRYNESSMVTSEIIDQYDMATSSTVSSIISFAREHPNYEEYPIMQELINDITDIDNRVIYRRVDYDNIAIEFNQFVKDNQEIIAKPGIKPKPLFQISQ